MKKLKKIAFLLLLTSTATLRAQISEGFENITLDSGKTLNGSDGTEMHYFSTGEMNFPVSWDTTYKYWASGWALSKVNYNKVEPSDYAKHLFSAATGYGVENGKGKTFIVGQNGSFFNLKRKNSGDYPLKGFYVSNSTYAYNSMKFGDFVAKKFGGNTGKDQDSFVLIIRSYKQSKAVDSQRVVLADFRFSDSAKDYILNQWKFVTLKDAYTDSIAFDLVSSDNGQFGMNTPAFFVLDGVEFYGLNAVKNNHKTCSIYPVPANDILNVKAESELVSAVVLDYAGRVLARAVLAGKSAQIQVSQLPQGNYVLQVLTREGSFSKAIQVTK
jgi:hypothetical protein